MKKTNKSMFFYGRARRLDLAKKIGFIVLCLVFIAICVSVILKREMFIDRNKNFEYLRSYLERNSYSCELIENSGGRCLRVNSAGGKNIFVRRDNGFEYSVKTHTYSVQIRHVKDTHEDIVFTTTSAALNGYKSKQYNCLTQGTIVSHVSTCQTENGELLDSDTYRGAINSAIDEALEILNASGYDINSLLKDYVWKK